MGGRGAVPSTGPPCQTRLLIPLELSNSLGGSFAMTAPYLPGMLTCFMELNFLIGSSQGRRRSQQPHWLLPVPLSRPPPLPWLCPKAWGWLLLPSARGGPARPPSQRFPAHGSRVSPLRAPIVLCLHLFFPSGSLSSLSVKSITIPASKGGCKSK